MKMIYKNLAATFGVFALAIFLVPNASATCGGVQGPKAMPSSWNTRLGGAHLLRAEFGPEPIVGFWHVKFVSKGSAGVPDYVEVDAGYAQWHSDGTEIMNSGHQAPISGDFCLGVWEKVGECKYRLNHFAAAWNAAGTALLGPVNIKEEVTVKPDGKSFTGTFSLIQYDENLDIQPPGIIIGEITGTRIDVKTPPSSIF